MGEFDASAAAHGLTIEAVDWLPSGGRSGLVRVRGRRPEPTDGAPAPLPELVVEQAGEVHRHASLPDPRAGRVPGAWRGAYVVRSDVVQAADAQLRLEFPGGVQIALARPGSGAPPPAPPPAPAVAAPESGGGEVVDRAVLADRRARRAEAAEQAQARIAHEALKAVEVLELRSAQLEERLEAVTAERDALSSRPGPGVVAPSPEIPELRRRLAEAEARVRELQARPVAAPPLRTGGSAEEAERRADRLRDALTTSIATVGELRLQLHEARVRSRTAEITHAAEAVRLRVLASERGAQVAELAAMRRAVEEAEQLRTIQAAEIERVTARAAGAEAAHEETRRQHADRVGELREARERIGTLESELAAVRAEIPQRVGEAVQETTRGLEARHAEAQRAMAERESEAQAAVDAARHELERVEAALARAETARELAEAAATATGMRLAAGDVARASGSSLAGETRADEAAGLAAELEAARAQIEAQSAKLVAVDALESELAQARALLATQSEALETARAVAAGADEDAATVAGLTAELGEARESLHTMSMELDELRSRTTTLAAELEAERARRREAEEAAAAERERLREAQARAEAAEAEREQLREAARAEAEAADAERWREPAAPPVPEELPRHAAEQEERAAITFEPPAPPERLVADLAAAAEALRARTPPEPEPEAIEPEPEPEATEAEPEPVAEAPEPAAEPAPVVAEPQPEPEPDAAEAEPDTAPVHRRTITSPDEPPPARIATGRDAREYPALRGALVKLAHDDPAAAARLLVGLLPAQWRVLGEPVDYDITIVEAGTYAVRVTAGGAHVRPLTGVRADAEFHLRADALTLAEMLSGHGPKPRRFGSPAKVSGKVRRVKALQPLAAASMSLPDAVRAGARLEPELVLRTLAYAVHPSWTAGHDFTVAHTFTGPDGDETLYITARDGRGLTISHDPPPGTPDTTVILTRTAFEALLRGEPPRPGERPATRGDHRAAQTLRAWADRARAGG
jgi:hypothetical protein